MTHDFKPSSLVRMEKRRAVAPIIATLILVAIAVVGGIMIFVFAQDFFGGEAVSGPGTIDSLTMTGYDARAVANCCTDHDGNDLAGGVGDIENAAGSTTALDDSEYFAIHVKNAGSAVATIKEIKMTGGGGKDFSSADPANNAEFSMYMEPLAGGGVAITSSAGIDPGAEATLLIAADQTIAHGRTFQVTAETVNGQTFTWGLVAGQTG